MGDLWKSNKLERIWLLAKIEFKLRYYENNLGLFWALLKPCMDILIYYVVFKVILKSAVPAFASFLFIGLIIWNFFVESTLGTIQILRVKKYLYDYSNMNKMEIYLSTLLSNAIGFFFNFSMFLLYFQFFEKESLGISWYNWWIVPIFISLFILSLGVSLILSTLFIVAKDISQIWQVSTTCLFFLSPILYNLQTFRESLPFFDYLNPIAGMVINARKVMMEHQPPDFGMFCWDFGYSAFILLIGMITLKKLGAKASEKL